MGKGVVMIQEPILGVLSLGLENPPRTRGGVLMIHEPILGILSFERRWAPEVQMNDLVKQDQALTKSREVWELQPKQKWQIFASGQLGLEVDDFMQEVDDFREFPISPIGNPINRGVVPLEKDMIFWKITYLRAWLTLWVPTTLKSLRALIEIYTHQLLMACNN